jgi:hypothetical protein
MKRLTLFAIVLCALPASATNYTVKAGGGGSYTTIQACATAMAAGDTCTVYAGTYAENVTVSSGTAGNYKTLTVNTGDTVYVQDFTIGSYIKINGFYIQYPSSPTSHACISVNGGATEYYVTNNNMYACNSFVTEATSFNTTYGYITGNTMSYPCSTSASPNVCRTLTINGDYHLIANNDISHVADGPYVFGKYNVLRDNTLHNLTDADCGSNSGNCHVDLLQADSNVAGGGLAAEYLLIEGNTMTNMVVTGSFAGAGMHAGPLLQGESCSGNCYNSIIRFNTASHVYGGGTTNDNSGTSPPAWDYVKSYNNDWVDMLLQNSGVGAEVNAHSHGSLGGANVNEIYYFSTSGAANQTNPYDCQDTACTGYTYGHSLAYPAAGGTLYGHTYGSGAFTADTGNVQANPLFNNYAANDFTLAAGSPALNSGTYLTTVASGDSGSGTSLVVTDASFFQGGSPLTGVQSDCVSVTTTTNHVCVTAVNYSTNTLTLATGITRTVGDSIWLYSDSSGTVVLPSAGPNMGSQFAAGPSAPTNLQSGITSSGVVTQ